MKTEKPLRGKLKKRLIIAGSSIILFLVVIILFISPITKFLVEKYDEKITGRQITMDWAYVNPLTGYFHFSNLKIFEFQSDSVFFATHGLSANVAMLKLFSQTFEVSDVFLNSPKGNILQTDSTFNFKDLLEKFNPNIPDSTKGTNAVRFNLLNVKVSNGEFHYRENITPINYFIKNVEFESSGYRWDADTIATTFSLATGIGTGEMEGVFTINHNNNDYHFDIDAHQFDLNIIEQYLKDLTNYGAFSAKLDASLKANGNFNDQESISTKGLIAISDFHFGKDSTEDYASFERLEVDILELSPKSEVYLFDTILLTHPFFKYERYDYLDNVQTMFGKDGNNVSAIASNSQKFNLVIEIANYIKALAQNFLSSEYKINSLAINDGDFQFDDYSLSEKFSIAFNPLSILADSIDKNHNLVIANFKTGILPFGIASAKLSINPKDSSDFDMTYHLQKLSLPSFNPYFTTYTSFPLDRGTIELNGSWKVRNGIISSDNHILIIDIRATDRLKNKSTSWLPIPLIMAFVRERGNVIDYEIPITGNLKNPKFKLRDVLTDVLVNTFVKPLTTPYRQEVKSIETEIEKSLSVKWKTSSSSLSKSQQQFIKKMAEFLEENPTATIDVFPQVYAEKEKEYILLFEGKKKYFMHLSNRENQTLTEQDSLTIDKMSVKDSLFVHYLNSHVDGTLLFTVQAKCFQLIGETKINNQYNQLNKSRQKEFLSFFNSSETAKRVKVHDVKTTTPYNGFSFYKIEYKGEFPESILDAYVKMDKLNDEIPRSKFKIKRAQNQKVSK